MSISRLCVRISNCWRAFLSTWGLDWTVYRSMRVGSGMGPWTTDPVRFAVSTISRRTLIQDRVIVRFHPDSNDSTRMTSHGSPPGIACRLAKELSRPTDQAGNYESYHGRRRRQWPIAEKSGVIFSCSHSAITQPERTPWIGHLHTAHAGNVAARRFAAIRLATLRKGYRTGQLVASLILPHSPSSATLGLLAE